MHDYNFSNSQSLIPGTFDPNKEKIYVRGMKKDLSMYNSQEKPRHIVLQGSDGKD